MSCAVSSAHYLDVRAQRDLIIIFYCSMIPLCRTKCCYGLSMDLLQSLAEDLGFEFHLYVVQDGHFGSKTFEPNRPLPAGAAADDIFRYYNYYEQDGFDRRKGESEK